MQVMLPPKGVITVAITAVIASVITDRLIRPPSSSNYIKLDQTQMINTDDK